MKPVGIIANPDSGKDIRRLVAYGSVFNNIEKSNIIKRILMALDSMNVTEVVIMPDLFGLGTRALGDVKVASDAYFLEMEIQGTQEDSIRATTMMREMGVACIITLGGDGTNRMVAKACGNVPLLPISTGTNNVFPFMIEGTVAGMAAGVLVSNRFPVNEMCQRTPRLEVYKGSELKDIALIDLVVTDDAYVGAKAVWEVDSLKEVFLTRSRPSNIGLSALGGFLNPLPSDANKGLHITVGAGYKNVKAPIAPGLIRRVPISAFREFTPEDEIPITCTPAVLAFDGEREVDVASGEHLTVRINPRGPLVVDINKLLCAASEQGMFISDM